MSDNPVPPREISSQDLAQFCVSHGWDQAVLYYRRDGQDGGEGCTFMGLTYRDGEIAREMADFLKKNVFGWKSEEAPELDKMITDAKREMAEAPQGGDPDTGKKLINLDAARTKKKKR